MPEKNYYITTTLPYVNDAPHIGFALEIIQADALARYKKGLGFEVVFNTGTDEHGLKIYEKSILENKNVQEYCDEYAKKFDHLKESLNLSYTNFIRTTDANHIKAAQYFWSLCEKNGDIYKKNYKLKYCKGCELEKTDSELENGRCLLHPKMEILIIEEENYFFRLSKFKDKLLELYNKNKSFVIPENKFNEIKNFVSTGLNDFSISRLKDKMPWGIAVPGDDNHVMYVWFDALINYLSTLGWPDDQENFKKFWPGTQVAGKDNLRQQSAMWQGMLLSANLPLSKQIFIHGFITCDGQKMSKSLGNVVDPYKVVAEYGTDVLRFYLLREIPSYNDGDYSENRMKEIYKTELANELGNLVSRLTTLGETDALFVDAVDASAVYSTEIEDAYQKFNFPLAVKLIWDEVRNLNREINSFEPWKKTASERKEFLISSTKKLNLTGQRLLPIMPSTAEKIVNSTNGSIKKCEQLFPRQDLNLK